MSIALAPGLTPLGIAWALLTPVTRALIFPQVAQAVGRC